MNCRENHLPQQLPDTAEEESSKPRWGVRLSSLALPWSCKELCKCLFSAILPLTRLPVVLHWKGELSLKMNNSFSGKRMNSLLESQINDLQGWFFFFFGGRKLCNGLAVTDWYKKWFKISCAKLYSSPQGKRYPCAQEENIEFWKKFISYEGNYCMF